MSDAKHDISVLNSLIETTLDSVHGYRDAAEATDDQRFKSKFQDRANERQQVTRDLQEAVRSLGGDPEDSGTLAGGAHRKFLDLKAAVTGRDDQSIINEVERGEDHIKSKYEDALKDTDLQPTTRTAIQKGWDSVKSGHAEMSALKHSMA